MTVAELPYTLYVVESLYLNGWIALDEDKAGASTDGNAASVVKAELISRRIGRCNKCLRSW